MTKVYLDCETIGFAGVPIIIQYAYDEGPIHVWDFWNNPIKDSLSLIEELMTYDVVGFNLAFDMFHLCKIYNMLRMFPDHDELPEDHIDELGVIEKAARDGVCVKPARSCDLMLIARKTKYQSTMDRKPITIRRVPRELAWKLAEALEKTIQFDPIYFAGKKGKKKKTRWNVQDIKGNPHFKNVQLKFSASTALKALAVDALGVKEDLLKFQDIEIEKEFMPIELPYAPFALAISKPPSWKGFIVKNRKKIYGKTWPGQLKNHLGHWRYYKPAIEYAKNDIIYTRGLYHYFNDPEPGDDDSELASMVANVRWKGYSIDIPKLQKQRNEAYEIANKYPTAPAAARAYIEDALTDADRAVLAGTTKKTVLEELARRAPRPCILCSGKGCTLCDKGMVNHPAAVKARNVLESRLAAWEVGLYDKLLQAGRFHASFIVIGTLSTRMAGTDFLNAQGIKRTNDVRSCFTFADDEYDLLGGDFAGFEVVLADASYGDPVLRKDLLTCDKCEGPMVANNGPPKCTVCGSMDGKKIHALFGIHVFPHLTYEQIKKSKGQPMDYYERSKRGVFSQLYGGDAGTMSRKIGIPIEDAEKGEKRFLMRYKQVAVERAKIQNMFCSMRQPGGIGSRVEWHEPSDYIESLMGDRRYFTLENKICKALFDLANKPPIEWRDLQIRVSRKEGRIQTAGGAVQSALYGAAFGIQGSNMRAAANHVIQSSGARITKAVQRKIWNLQPPGVSNWKVQPCNIHDEILCPTAPDYKDKVGDVVHETVESFRPKVPLIVMEWSDTMRTWADK